MCIIGMISEASDIIARMVESMARMPHYSQDACGVATLSSSTIHVRTGLRSVRQLSRQRAIGLTRGCIGITHTGRVAADGGISYKNTQPHLSCDGSFGIVIEGMISNSLSLRADLETKARHFFFSDADAEVLGHLLEETYLTTRSIEEAFVQALRELEGSFAMVMISNYESPQIFCAQRQLPLMIGISGQATLVSSAENIVPFETSRAYLLGQGQYAILSAGGYRVATITKRM